MTGGYPQDYDDTVASVCSQFGVAVGVVSALLGEGIVWGESGATQASSPSAVVSRPPPTAEVVNRMASGAGAASNDRQLVGTPMAWPKGGAAKVVWTGFQMTGEGSRVYLQASNDVEVSVQSEKSGLTVTVRNCRLHLRNGGRPLDTRFFATPVTSVAVNQRKRDVLLHIGLKEAIVDVVPHKESGPDGSQFWVLDFPAAKSLLADGSRPGPSTH